MAESSLIKATDIPVGTGPPSEQEARKWIDEQIPYRNWAGFSTRLDADVKSWAEGLHTDFQSRMMRVHQIWSVNWSVANGNPVTMEHADDIHVPETAKMLALKEVRIKEALFDFEQFFEVEGTKDELSELSAMVISSYLQRMLELAGYRDYVGPGIKDAQLCQLSATKVIWDKAIEDLVDRNVELRFRKNGEPYWHCERRMQRAVVNDGPSLELVDPWRLIIDLDAGQMKDLSYIGDISEQYLHILEQRARLGLFPDDKIQEIRDRTDLQSQIPGGQGDGTHLSELNRLSRSIVLPEPSGQRVGNRNSARRVRTLEMWGWYDFREGYDGVTDPLGRRLTGYHKIVATIGDGVVIQARLNPFDRKFAPYGVCRLNKNGHEMFSRGPFDLVILANAQYDRAQSNILRHLDLAVAPWLITGPDSDLPDSLQGVLPGTIMRNPGEFGQVKIPDVPQSVSYFHSYFRRECEELAGAMRVLESGERAATATEIERRIQESSRLIRDDVRAEADRWRQITLIFYWMAAQFSTGTQRFMVSGKAAERLGRVFEVTPDFFQEDIDVRFIGVESLHTLGSRTTGMVQWQNGWAPMAPMLPNFDWEALAKVQWEGMVGRERMSEVFKIPEPAWSLWPQSEENVLLRQGRRVPVSRDDNHREHQQDMVDKGMLKLALDDKTPDYIRNHILDHWNEHGDFAEQVEMEERMKRQRTEQQAELTQIQGGTPGVDRAPVSGGMPASSTAGVTPGPTQERTVARSGRQGAGQSQSGTLSQDQ